jgi:two-component system, LytTR family, sensor kinase
MKKTGILLLHLGYWLMFLFVLLILYFFVFYVPSPASTTVHSVNSILRWFWLSGVIVLIPGIIAFYVFYQVLVPRYLSHKRLPAFLLSGLLVSILAALAGAAIASTPLVFGSRFLFGDGYDSAFAILLIMSFAAFVNGIIGAVMKGFVTWYNELKLKESLTRKNYEMELNLVRSQINPHFLFNTINNIDILISKDATMASAYLNKLSDIMRFMLYETKTEHIALEKELAYIEKYIELQKIRSSNPDYVSYTVEGDPSGIFIAPLIFIPFIENAFKHTEYKKLANAIRIRIVIRPDLIDFFCENNFSQVMLPKSSAGGLGNALIEKRLQLLYPGNHTLSISKANQIYTVKLAIPRHDH